MWLTDFLQKNKMEESYDFTIKTFRKGKYMKSKTVVLNCRSYVKENDFYILDFVSHSFPFPAFSVLEIKHNIPLEDSIIKKQIL